MYLHLFINGFPVPAGMFVRRRTASPSCCFANFIVPLFEFVSAIEELIAPNCSKNLGMVFWKDCSPIQYYPVSETFPFNISSNTMALEHVEWAVAIES